MNNASSFFGNSYQEPPPVEYNKSKEFSIKAEISIYERACIDGYNHPVLRIEVDNLTQEVEDEFIEAATKMMREAFASSRKQKEVKDRLNKDLSYLSSKGSNPLSN